MVSTETGAFFSLAMTAFTLWTMSWCSFRQSFGLDATAPLPIQLTRWRSSDRPGPTQGSYGLRFHGSGSSWDLICIKYLENPRLIYDEYYCLASPVSTNGRASDALLRSV